MTFESALLLLSWLAILLLAFGMSGLLAQVRELQGSVTPAAPQVGLTPGVLAPGIAGWIGASELGTLVLFADMDCSTCGEIVPAFQAVDSEAGPDRIVVMRSLEGHPDQLRLQQVPTVEDAGAFAAYRISMVPTAVAIDPSGRILYTQRVGSRLLLNQFMGRFNMARAQENIEA